MMEDTVSINQPGAEQVALIPKGNAEPPRWGRFNVIVMGLSFLLLFSGFNTASSYLTTALNENVAFYSLSILYATFALSNFVSAAFVKQFGPRVSLIFAACLYLLFVAAAVRIIVPLYLVASSLCGFGAAILWTAQGSFLTNCSSATNVSFNTGLFFAIFQVNNLVGYPIAAVLVNKDKGFGLIFSVLFLIAASGVLLMFALRRVHTHSDKPVEGVSSLMLSTLRLFQDPKIWAMLALVLYSGMSASFFVGIFPKAMGKKRIAWAQMCYGVAEVVGSFATGKLASVIGRVPLLLFTFVAHTASLVLAYQTTDHNVTAIYFLASTMFGLGDSTLQTTIYSVLANLYSDKSESAFAYYKFAQSLGYTICFLLSIQLLHHIRILVAILAGLLVVALVGVLVLQWVLVDVNHEVRLRKRSF